MFFLSNDSSKYKGLFKTLEKSFVIVMSVFVLNKGVRSSWLLQVTEAEEASKELTLSSSSLTSAWNNISSRLSLLSDLG